MNNEIDDRIWFAVQKDPEDDWSFGTYDKDEAIEMLKKQGCGLIAAIDNMTCIYEIYYEDVIDQDQSDEESLDLIYEEEAHSDEDVEFELFLLTRSLHRLSEQLHRSLTIDVTYHEWRQGASANVQMYVERKPLLDAGAEDRDIRTYDHIRRDYEEDDHFVLGIMDDIRDLEAKRLADYKK